MSEPSSNGTKSAISAGEHIKTLNKIAEDIPILLQSAGAAISQLQSKREPIDATATELPESVSEHIDDSDPEASRKRAFVSHVHTYYTTLRRIRDQLRAEVDALSEAGLLESSLEGNALGFGVTNGGLGDLDVGWLNSRAKDVGAGKERELVKELRELLEYYKKVKESATKIQADDNDDGWML